LDPAISPRKKGRVGRNPDYPPSLREEKKTGKKSNGREKRGGERTKFSSRGGKRGKRESKDGAAVKRFTTKLQRVAAKNCPVTKNGEEYLTVEEKSK